MFPLILFESKVPFVGDIASPGMSLQVLYLSIFALVVSFGPTSNFLTANQPHPSAWSLCPCFSFYLNFAFEFEFDLASETRRGVDQLFEDIWFSLVKDITEYTRTQIINHKIAFIKAYHPLFFFYLVCSEPTEPPFVLKPVTVFQFYIRLLACIVRSGTTLKPERVRKAEKRKSLFSS